MDSFNDFNGFVPANCQNDGVILVFCPRKNDNMAAAKQTGREGSLTP